jgi:6-phosphogluconolactonase
MSGGAGGASDAARREIRVLPAAGDLPAVAAEAFVAALAAAPAAGGASGKPPSVLLSGGSTPRALFQLLADPRAPYRARVAWNAVHFFWGDERHVPPDDAESNFRMAREAMLDHVPVSAAQIHRIAGEEPDAAVAAARYERDIAAHFGLRADRGEMPAGAGAGGGAGASASALDWPRFDLVLLGLGEEGHTASLFPGSPVLDERRRLTAAPWVAAHDTYRITVTPPVLNHAALVMFLVSGAAKAPAVAAVIEGARQPAVYPAQVVAPNEGKLVWLLDEAAAAGLRSR